MPRLVLISDTHRRARALRLPAGDILIHAGDFSMSGEYDEILGEMEWFARFPHRFKVIIAGNHDFAFQEDMAPALRMEAIELGLDYLQDSEVNRLGVTIWGSPWQPWFHDWAFNLHRGPAIRAKWDLIPPRMDVVVTHGPAAGYGGMTLEGEEAGCEDLRYELVERVKPLLHVSGHIHEGYGDYHHPVLPIRFVNASVLDRQYRLVNAPIVVDL